MVPPAIFCATATLSKPVFRTRLGAGAKEIRTPGPTLKTAFTWGTARAARGFEPIPFGAYI